jgi:hypothetical protein
VCLSSSLSIVIGASADIRRLHCPFSAFYCRAG